MMQINLTCIYNNFFFFAYTYVINFYSDLWGSIIQKDSGFFHLSQSML